MHETPLHALLQLDQSVWYDNIHRDMLRQGELARMVREEGVTGVTSNPTIFEKAIGAGQAYEEGVAEAVRTEPDAGPERWVERLAVADIQAAADVLRPVYDRTEGRDGMISLEVSPELADDSDGTIAAARRLWSEIDRPNAMIKVPATEAGLTAIETLIADGINVNVTLLFARERYRRVAEAYIRGLERRAEAGQAVTGIASVASFFVSRVDTAVEQALGAAIGALAGEVAIANARLAYQDFLEIFDGSRFQALRAQGAQPQRLLWASTGTKNPAYSDVLYVEALIGARTVTTLPPATFEAYRDHGEPQPRLESGIDQAEQTLQTAQAAGIDLDAITARLEQEGVQAFTDSYRTLLQTIEAKTKRLDAAQP